MQPALRLKSYLNLLIAYVYKGLKILNPQIKKANLLNGAVT